MKNPVQWTINILLLLGLCYLLIMQCENEETPNEIETNVVEPIITDEVNPQIAFVNSDSIWDQYQMVIDLTDELEAKQKQFKRSLEAKASAFEKEVIEFQQTAGQMSQFEGQQKQQDLLEKEQELGKLQQEWSNQLLDLEAKMQKEIRNDVANYLVKYQDEGINYILDRSANSSTLMATDTLDITKEVIQGLNDQYKKEDK